MGRGIVGARSDNDPLAYLSDTPNFEAERPEGDAKYRAQIFNRDIRH
jgi:hypothetical protein